MEAYRQQKIRRLPSYAAYISRRLFHRMFLQLMPFLPSYASHHTRNFFHLMLAYTHAASSILCLPILMPPLPSYASHHTRNFFHFMLPLTYAVSSMATVIFDFDSTLITCETLEEVLKEKIADPERMQQIKEITEQGMSGKVEFPLFARKPVAHGYSVKA